MEGRLETGIPGLDEMAGGGWIVPSSILVAGAPGTGKTTLAVQTLFHGASKGETGVYFTGISEPAWVVQGFLKAFGFFDQALVDKGKVVFIDIGQALRRSAEDGVKAIEKEVERLSPTRIVIDPITALRATVDSERHYREALHDLTTFMKSLNSVMLLTSESDYDERHPGIEGHMLDAILVLSHPKEGHARRLYLEIVKMRGSAHVSGEQSADLSKAGFFVHPGLH